MSPIELLAAFSMLALPTALSWYQFRGFTRERRQR
jgi:hypothetical protein